MNNQTIDGLTSMINDAETTYEQGDAEIDKAVERFATGKARLFRDDGAAIYADAVYREKLEALTGELHAVADRVAASAEAQIATVNRLQEIEHTDPIGNLSLDEQQQASARGHLAISSVTPACTWDGSKSGRYGEQFRPWQAVSHLPEALFSCHADCTPASHIMRRGVYTLEPSLRRPIRARMVYPSYDGRVNRRDTARRRGMELPRCRVRCSHRGNEPARLRRGL